MFDTDGNREIDRAEFGNFLHSVGALSAITEAETEGLFRYLDKDNSGGFDTEEFRTWFNGDEVDAVDDLTSPLLDSVMPGSAQAQAVPDRRRRGTMISVSSTKEAW